MSIETLIPFMPTAEALLPFLHEIDHNKYYSNFGPLYHQLKAQLLSYLSQRCNKALDLTLFQSGTHALELALAELNLAPGANVLVPAFTFISSALAIKKAGYNPIFSDVDENTWILTPSMAEKACTQYDIQAVMPVAAFSHPLDVDGYDKFYLDTGIPVIIDAAGALTHHPIGRYSLIVFSLHATKIISCGEGGLVACADHQRIQTLRRLTEFGLTDNLAIQLGTNSKLSEYHAAVGLASLQSITEQCDKLQALKVRYLEQLDRLPTVTYQPNIEQYDTPIFAANFNHVAATYVAEQLKKYQIQSKKWYSPSLHRHPLFENMRCAGALPVTEYLEEHLLCLPFHCYLELEDVDRICQVLAEVGSD